jgi:hypothetical protein
VLIVFDLNLKVLESVSFFLGGKKCSDLNFPQLILLVEKDKQVLQMGKTITEKYLYLYALRGCVRPLRIVPLNNLCCAAQSFLITIMFTIF